MATVRGSMAEQVSIIPGLSTKRKNNVLVGQLLRRPRAPKVLPPLPLRPTNNNELDRQDNDVGSVIRLFQDAFELEALQHVVVDPELITSGGSRAPSLATSPPPSENGQQNIERHTTQADTQMQVSLWQKPLTQNSLFISRDDMKYILDPLIRGKTSLGTYIDGKSLVKPFKSRGPDPLPKRAPRKNLFINLSYETDDQRYMEPPAFTLEQFVYKLAESRNLSVPRVRKIVYSKHNVKKLTDMLAMELNPSTQDKVHTVHFDASDLSMKENRVPQRQLLYEMAAMIKQHVREAMGTEMKSVIRPMSKYSPAYTEASRPHTEIILYENDASVLSNTATRIKQASEMPGVDAVLHSAHSRYFHGSERSRSPYGVPEDETITPSELAILDTLISGGTALSLKAHFIEDLPDITPLTKTLTYVNLSFNNFRTFPQELFHLENLTVLKMRNNPLYELPADINRLHKLQVLIASFCLIASLPPSLFDMPSLEDLSLGYNKLTFLPREMSFLQSLKVLDIEGNQIPALPASCLTMLNLSHVNVRNNFMHPLFWKENTKNKPQSLLDLACVHVYRSVSHETLESLPGDLSTAFSRVQQCDCCRGPLFGPGLRTICPVSKLFSVKNIPIMFEACTPECLENFKKLSPESLRSFLYGQ
ncbi:unnamed protein product [Lymnaea stagnalis]|uniref:Leucine-rich repeat-containing protein 63 n=1 Tax=Lymnaea stagnalis TaxID=6523 RepID=A0AAV2IPP9_LYMST